MSGDVTRYRFAGWQFDSTTGDVTAPDGSLRRLRPQAGQILALLLERSGELVTREALQGSVWPDTIVEFDQGLNACIREIRKALDDDAGDPEFVETFPRRGYRFLVPAVPIAAGSSTEPESVASDGRPATVRIAVGAAVVAAIVATSMGLGLMARSGGPSSSAPDRALPETSTGSSRARLLVLPLRSPGSDAALDTVADILTERLIGDLSRLGPDRLGVIARTSAHRYGATNPTLREMADQLDLDLVVEGAVVRGGEPTVQLRLVDPEDATQLWAGEWPVDPSAVGEVADRAGGALATAVAPDLGEAHRNLVVRRAGDAPVRDALARIEYLLGRHTMADTERALGLIEGARAADPDHPGLLSALATVRYRMGEVAEAERLARRAVAAQPTFPEAHRILGVLAQRGMVWDSARSHLERAVRLAPGDPAARTSLAVLLNYMGRADEAVHHIESALALDPVSATLASDAGVVFLWAGRYEEAERHCRAAITLSPEARAARRCLVRVAHLTGRPELGAEPAARLLELDGPGRPGGNPSEILREYWEWVQDRSGDDGCGPVVRARALIVLERPDEAVTTLQSLGEDESACMLQVVADPIFDGVRPHAGLVRRIDVLGLPPASAP